MGKRKKQKKNKKQGKKLEKVTDVMVSIAVLFSIFAGGYFFSEFTEPACAKQSLSVMEPGKIITRNNKTYQQHLENYYDIAYQVDKDGATFQIKNNSCIDIIESTGGSMKPFWEEKTINIIDECYDNNNLEVGDVIVFQKEYKRNEYVQHRIVEINFEDKWVRTQGDGNDLIDDFKGFEYIKGKTIGFLNVLTDKKMVEEEIDRNISQYLNMTDEVLDILRSNWTSIRSINIAITCICSTECLIQICTNNESKWSKNLSEANCDKCNI